MADTKLHFKFKNSGHALLLAEIRASSGSRFGKYEGLYEPGNKTRAIPRASGIFQRDDASPTRDGSLFVNKILNASVTMPRFNCLEIWLEASFRARPRSPTYREITAFSAFLLLGRPSRAARDEKILFPQNFDPSSSTMFREGIKEFPRLSRKRIF